eukprot:TRINITY_DN36487_c0_g1_i1.p1 TRINITY_DN36487_c0_g1~~TRINITY_DN36487_c0_g1_i1.p1  ORF type:complete len:373 (+),score=91.62 TRINITY_DN36487_c0_g1_i1:94-1212(+)
MLRSLVGSEMCIRDRLQLGWVLQYDHMEERKCTLEATRRVLLRIVRCSSVTCQEWPWDLCPGESLSIQASTVMTLSPAAVPCSPVQPESSLHTPSPAERPTGPLQITIDGLPASTPAMGNGGTRQAILASIESLINVGMPPKQILHRLTSWPKIESDRAWLESKSIADPKPLATSVIRALVPLVGQKGLEMSVVRLVLEVLAAACILTGELGRCMPRIAESMVLRLRREGVTSQVEQQKIEACSNLGMHSNETKVDTADSSDEGDPGGDESSDWDDDSWDDEAGVLSTDTLVCEFGKFLKAMSVHFPDINTIDKTQKSVGSGATPGKPSTSSVVEFLATSSSSPCCWPGLSDENARVLNWVLVTACANTTEM